MSGMSGMSGMEDDVDAVDPELRKRLIGFRVSVLDALVLSLVAAGAVWLWDSTPFVAGLALMVVAHFFLFCNVVRLRTPFELIWAVIFLGNVAVWSGLPSFAWWKVFCTQLPVTLLFILLEMRSGRYHGIGCEFVNSDIDGYVQWRIEQFGRHDKDVGKPAS